MTSFTWKKGVEKCLLKTLYRKQRQLATNHPDLMITEPEECKQQKSDKPLLKHCEEKIIASHLAYQRKVAVPLVKTEKRFNKL